MFVRITAGNAQLMADAQFPDAPMDLLEFQEEAVFPRVFTWK
jgi:hypothetical protein